MNRRQFLGAAAALPLAQVALGEESKMPPAGPAQRRPNVLLILTDDQGYGDVGCHGNDKLKTPNLDRLAAEGVEFTHFYVSPVCAPTRSSLMTGRYNYRTGAIDTYLGRAMMHPDEVTLAELLGPAGYRTGIFGKWHLGDNYPLRPNDQGFQEALVLRGGGLCQPSDPPGGNSYTNPILEHNGREVKTQGYCTDVYTDAALKFIEESRERPWFVYHATNAPHIPLQVPDRYVEPYRKLGISENTARVYGMVANVDENVGRLLAKLKELGLEENTIVIFMTDNGPCPATRERGQPIRFNGGLRDGKCTVYDGGIRVPFFIRWPGKLQAGRKIETVAAHIDVLPTLLDACGVAKPADLELDGLDFLPLLLGRAGDWPDRTIYIQWHRGDAPVLYRSCMARGPRYKLVDGKELYDMAADPGEQHDIAAEHPDIVAAMRKGYEEWFRDVSATRGYDPPRIVLGTPHENPTRLTRQDWRGPRAGWDASSLGHWEVRVGQACRYEVTLLFARAAGAAQAHFQLGKVSLDKPLAAGATSCSFESVPLDAGDGRLEAWIEQGGKTVGVRYVEVKRMD